MCVRSGSSPSGSPGYTAPSSITFNKDGTTTVRYSNPNSPVPSAVNFNQENSAVLAEGLAKGLAAAMDEPSAQSDDTAQSLNSLLDTQLNSAPAPAGAQYSYSPPASQSDSLAQSLAANLDNAASDQNAAADPYVYASDRIDKAASWQSFITKSLYRFNADIIDAMNNGLNLFFLPNP